MMGLGENSNIVHIIDFGLARSFIDPKTGEHIPPRKYRSLVGTCLFCSLNSHNGTELSSRDDLITIGYIVLLFLRGRLPWQNVHADETKERYKKIGQLKQLWSNQQICEGLPPQILVYMDYVMSLRFDQPASFQMMKRLVADCAREYSIDLFDNVFDWNLRLC